MAIRYVAYTKEGERVAGTLNADSAAAAEETLWRSDLIVVSLRQARQKSRAGPSRLARLLPTLYRPKVSDLVNFTRDLATLLESGIALHTSLRVIQDRVANPLFKEAVKQVSSDIEAGGSLSQAVAKQPNMFPAMYPRLVTVGEETGRLDIALRQISNHLEKQAATGQKLRRALGYPAFVGLLGIGAAFMMMTYTLPALMKLFQEYEAQLPLTTRLLMATTGIMDRYGIHIALAVAVTGVSLFLYFRSRQGAPRWDRLIFKFPMVGRVVWLANVFRFTSTLHTLLAAGLPLTEALDLTATAATNTKVQAAIVKLRQDVTAGQSLSQALAQQPIFPDMIHQMVTVGEESGSLTQNLATLSAFYEQEADRGVSGLTGMIEPVMLLMVGGLVGFIALSTMSALYG
ncbi:MAG: type II secretion system F family protein, partial [Chloroflexota bacterium]